LSKILTSRDRSSACKRRGTGKTTGAISSEGSSEKEGYEVRGFAPTNTRDKTTRREWNSKARPYRSLSAGDKKRPDHNRLFVVDESSLASTRTFTSSARLNLPARCYLSETAVSTKPSKQVTFRAVSQHGMATVNLVRSFANANRTEAHG